jgi:diketogulonate reductase-like aldo/keto reductase
MNGPGWNRRDILSASLALGLAPALCFSETGKMQTRPIPHSNESMPVIGLGTYAVFDIAGSAEELAAPREIVALLVEKGGSMIDSSPMYDRSEKVVGDIVEAGGYRDKLFLATKVWTNGRSAGEAQMERSAALMQAGTIDLMQVHNLRDVDVHMPTIRQWQEDGRIRYNGLTHYTAGAHRTLARAMEDYKPQFIQINYSLGEREAEQRVLPLAKDLGIAVLINRPFMAGRLFRAVRGRQLPGWAAEFASSWGQFFLKFIVSHPAVTCVIPATSKPQHMVDNLGAGFGAMPDQAARQKMATFWDAL